METTALTNEQSPIERDHLFKLNFDYLFKYYESKQLQNIASSFGISIYEKHEKRNYLKRLTKIKLSEQIIRHEKYSFLSKDEIDKCILEKNEIEKKAKYEGIKERLYENTKTLENENYEIPCLVYDGYNRIKINS